MALRHRAGQACWGVQGGLKQVAAFLNVDAQKDAAGTRLINKFSKATAKPVASRGRGLGALRGLLRRDVDCEMKVACELPGPIPSASRRSTCWTGAWAASGVGVDARLAASARAMAEADARASPSATWPPSPASPTRPAQLLGWLQGRGCPSGAAGREVLEAAREGCDPLAREAIEMRLAAQRAGQESR
ncbi:MAG: hypothetical protein V8S24_07175 [Gordonibacter pamelaeae]